MALMRKLSEVVGLTIGRNYSTAVKTLLKPIEIPMDRVFENVKTGTKFELTNEYSVAKNGINNRKEFVIYFPDKFKLSYHKRYDDMKSSGIELITKFNIAKPGTKKFRDLVNTRSDAMSALSLVTDAHNTDNIEFVRAYHDNLVFVICHDDFMLKLLPQKFAKFEQQYVNKLKLAHRLNKPKLFDRKDSKYSSEERYLIDEANNMIFACNNVGKRLRKHCSENVFENYCNGNDIFYDYSVIESTLMRQNRPITWNEFISVGPYQTAVHGVWALNDHKQPVMSLFDPFITYGMLYVRLWNDVLSHHKELQTLEKASFNSVTVLQNMYPNITTIQAMTEVMRITNKILNDMEQHVEYLRDEEKQTYIKLFKHFIGLNEPQLLSKRFGWKRISGTPSMYETLEHNGVIYGNDEY